MAYTRKRSYSKRYSAPARGRGRVSSRRRTSGRRVRKSSSVNTIRLVIEQPPSNPVSRPEFQGLMTVPTRKARF